MLKKIATAAPPDCEELLGTKVNLQCWVKVRGAKAGATTSASWTIWDLPNPDRSFCRRNAALRRAR